MTCVKSKWVNKRRIEVCFSPDVILCGWLGSKYLLTNLLQHRKHSPRQMKSFSFAIIHSTILNSWAVLWLLYWNDNSQSKQPWFSDCSSAYSEPPPFFSGTPLTDFRPVSELRSGELRTQKLKSHLVRTQSLNVLPLKPGVSQYIAIHATLTARDFFRSCLFVHFRSIHLHFFQNLSRFFHVLAVANTWFLCRPAE